MPGPLIRDIVIVGGGTAGWMTAAALSNHLGRACSIRLVESDEIGIIGVGEATIPHIVSFNRILGIDEDEFLRATRGTFKLGIEFVNWSAIGDRYIHGFGKLGPDLDGLPFHHFWLRGVQAGLAAGLGDYSINTAAPRRAKFMRPKKPEQSMNRWPSISSPLASFNDSMWPSSPRTRTSTTRPSVRRTPRFSA